MRRVVVAVLVMLLPARAAPAQASPTRPYSATWADAGWVTAGGALSLLPRTLGLPKGSPSCAPCDPATLPGIDRWAVRPVSDAADAASSVVLVGVAGWTVLAGLRGLPADEWRRNFATFAEATSWTAASTEWLKVLVRRKRPVLYTSDAALAVGRRMNAPPRRPGGLARVLGLRDGVLCNIAPIVGLRWLTTAPQFGPASRALWVLAMVTFSLPSGGAVRELTDIDPGAG